MRHIAKLLAQGPRRSRNYFFVALRDSDIVGYYHATRHEATWFLNYVAVAKMMRGMGIGEQLLRHFEDTGQALGCALLELDVFESNERAYDWYLQRGYQLGSASYQVRIAIGNGYFAASGILRWNKLAWLRAHWNETLWGFSKLDCWIGDANVTVGLISQTTCKLLSYVGLTLEQAVAAIERTFETQRRVLILPNLSALPQYNNLVGWERALRLSKPIEVPSL